MKNKRRRSLFLSVFILLKLLSPEAFCTSQGRAFSVFFSEAELKDISGFQEKKISSRKKEGQVCLRGLLYHSPRDWTLWINDFQITSLRNSSLIQVKKISPGEVLLEWTQRDQKHIILLKPHQSYDPALKKVREGCP